MARLPSSCPQPVSIAHGAPAHGRSGLRAPCWRHTSVYDAAGSAAVAVLAATPATLDWPLLDWRGYTLRTCYGCMMESAIMPDSTCGLTLTENT